MNNEKKKQTKKLSGFYIALCSCVLMIGVAGYFTEKYAQNSETVINNQVPKSDDEDIFSDDLTVSSAVTATLPPTITIPPVQSVAPIPTEIPAEENAASETMDYAIDNPDISSDAITVSSEPPTFIMPINGEIIHPFTEVLEYSPLMGDWRAHKGVDIASEKGCSAQAAASGVVDKVYDNAMGKCVEISHAGGFVSRYMCLDTVESLSDGKEVQSGEVIGTIGDGKGEDVTQPHLHFELSKDNVNVNPCDYLPN